MPGTTQLSQQFFPLVIPHAVIQNFLTLFCIYIANIFYCLFFFDGY